MSVIFEDCAGTVHAFESGSGRGFYQVDPSIPVPGSAKVIIRGAPLSLSEIFQTTTTLDGARIIHTFGSAWSESSLEGMLLLGPNSERGAATGSLIQWYMDNRLSVRKKAIGLSLGDYAISPYLVGMRLAAADSDKNLQRFSLHFQVTEE